MIFTAIISLSLILIGVLLAVLPSSNGFPQEVTDAANYIGSYMGIFDVIVPMSTIADIVTLVIIFELALFSFKAVRWIVSYMPLIGGRG
jgi:hypothetical protein